MKLKIDKGSKVYYHSIIGEPHDGIIREVRAIGTIPSSEEAVAWLVGKSGCVAFSALSKVA